MTTPLAITIIDTPENGAQSIACLLEAGEIACRCMTPKDCLAALDQEPSIGLILIDLLPSSSDVFEFLNQVLYRSLCPPILLLTGQETPLRLTDHFPSGNVLLLPGPVPPGKVIETVKRLIGSAEILLPQ